MNKNRNKKNKSTQVPTFVSKLLEIVEVHLSQQRIKKSKRSSAGPQHVIHSSSKTSPDSQKKYSPPTSNIITLHPSSGN